MGFRLLLYIWGLLCFGGHALAEEPGTDFAVVFMENLQPSRYDLRLEVLLTAFFPDTQVTIQLPNLNYSKVVVPSPRSVLPVQLPTETELLGPYRSNNTVRITSSKPISVVATSSKLFITSVAVLSPVDNWGMEYYVLTPDIGPEDLVRQMAIVNGPQPNSVSILLKGLVVFEDTTYFPGEYLALALNPWEAVQLQTNASLSGSHVLSQEPVALFSGLACTEMSGKCQHFFQLPPVSAWGSSFASIPLPFQKTSSKIFILTETLMEIMVEHVIRTSLTVTPGVVTELDFDPMTPLYIFGFGKLLVFLYFGGGLHEPAEGFLFHLLPREKSCVSYSIVWVPGFNNTALVVVQEGREGGLQLDHQPLTLSNWQQVPDGFFIYNFLSDDGSGGHFIYNSEHVFGVATIGTAEMSTYGAHGVCLDEGSRRLAHDFINPDQPSVCDGGYVDLSRLEYQNMLHCIYQGIDNSTQPEGSSDDFLYPVECIVELASVSDEAEAFKYSINVEYVVGSNRSEANLIIRVYGLYIVIPAHGTGRILVNRIPTSLPVCLASGKVKLWLQHPHVVLMTDFGLLVTYSFGEVVIGSPADYQSFSSGWCSKAMVGTELRLSGELLALDNMCDVQITFADWTCENETRGQYLCSLLLAEDGPFQDCHETSSPQTYFEECQRLLCENQLRICDVFQEYTKICQAHGAAVEPWRNDYFCPFPCPRGEQYNICTRPCGMCEGRLCFDSLCTEGCNCSEGLLWDGSLCVAPELCGEAQSSQNEALSLPTDVNCGLNVQDPACRFCSVDAFSLRSFGNLSSEISPNGTYDILRNCNASISPWMRIALSLHPPLPGHLFAFFGTAFIVVNNHLDVSVNGAFPTLPVTVAPNMYLSKTGEGISIAWLGYLDLSFNNLGQLNLAVSENLATELCGICALPSDDFSLESWKVEDLS